MMLRCFNEIYIIRLKLQESDQNSDEETFKDSSTFLKDLNE